MYLYCVAQNIENAIIFSGFKEPTHTYNLHIISRAALNEKGESKKSNVYLKKNSQLKILYLEGELYR